VTADLIITGKILTGTSNQEIAQVMAVKEGKICYIGDIKDSEYYRGPDTRLIDISNGCIIPGIFEGHAHPTSGVPIFQGINLYEKESVAHYRETIDDYIQTYPQKQYIIGRGFINSHFGQMGPSAEYLDKKYPDKFFYLESEDCHSCLVSGNVLQLAGINKDTKEWENGVIVREEKSGNPTGWLKEKEMTRIKNIYPRATVEEYKNTILKFQEMSIRNGITAAYEPMVDDDGNFENKIEAYYQLDNEDRLILDFRIGITIDPSDGTKNLIKIAELQKQKKGKHIEIMGIKIFVDGVVEGHTAYLREDYADAPGDCGRSMWNQNILNQIIAQAIGMDMTVHVHVMGDAALDCALESFEVARSIHGPKDLRNCLTHLQIVQTDQFIQMKNLNLIAVTNPYWHFRNPAYFEKLESPYLGDIRAENEYPVKEFFSQNIVVTQASDWPVSFSNNPFIGMEIAVTRKEIGSLDMKPLNQKEAVSRQDMFQALTANGAYQMKLEKELGTLEVGKRANFVILDQNPMELIESEIAKIKVIGNFFEGIDYLGADVRTRSIF